MVKTIKLAGIPIGVSTLFDFLPDAAEYETDEEPAFSVCITEQDIVDEQRKSIMECQYEGLAYPGYSPPELESTAVYRKIAMRLPEYDALVFHGSAVAVNEKAYLFTAKSGTGKTTHTDLWLKNIPGSFVVNGDKPILRIMDGTTCVCGTPWMGKEKMGCSRIVPLSGLCMISRGETNAIEKVSLSELMPLLIGQAYRPPEGAMLIRTVKLLEQIGKSTELYRLSCNMEDEAAFTAYRGMCHDEI